MFRNQACAERVTPEHAYTLMALRFDAANSGLSNVASLPADEDYARSVLAIFCARNVRRRESLALSDVSAAFLVQNMGRPADLRLPCSTQQPRAGSCARSTGSD
jgi:hypothetical protein